jgi:CRP-like cAMP-binding protein
MNDSSVTVEQLRKIKSLDRLTDGELHEFLRYVEPVPWPRQKVLLEEGEKGDRMYFILKGTMRVFSRKKRGEAVTLNILREGDAFGDIALFHQTTRKASVESVEDSLLLELTASSLDKLQAEQPAISAQFLQALAYSLGQMYSHY